jgi:hypothetical protein
MLRLRALALVALVLLLTGCSGPGSSPSQRAPASIQLGALQDDWDCDGVLDEVARLSGHAPEASGPFGFDGQLEADLVHEAAAGAADLPAGHWSFALKAGDFQGGWRYWAIDGRNLTIGQTYRLTATATLPNGTALRAEFEFVHGQYARALALDGRAC